MIVYKDYLTFLINGDDVNIISDEINGNINTVAEIDNIYYNFGNELPNIYTAILMWEEFNRKLDTDEISQIMKDNNLLT